MKEKPRWESVAIPEGDERNIWEGWALRSPRLRVVSWADGKTSQLCTFKGVEGGVDEGRESVLQCN